MVLTEYVRGKSFTELAVTDNPSDVVFKSENVMESGCSVIWVTNTGPNQITVAEVEVSPDNEDWFPFNSTALLLESGAKNTMKIESYPFFRIRMACASGLSTTVNIGLTFQEY